MKDSKVVKGKRPRIKVTTPATSVRAFVQKPIELKPVEIKPITFTPYPTAKEIMAKDPSAYGNALISAQQAAKRPLQANHSPDGKVHGDARRRNLPPRVGSELDPKRIQNGHTGKYRRE